MTRIIAPALTVMVAVVTMLASAQWNRSGEPLLVITVTERELAAPVRVRTTDDDPALRLRLAFEGRHDPLDARNWLPEERLRQIGFTFNVLPGAPQAAHVYDNVPSRQAWVALEYDGPAWREIDRRRQLQQTADAEPPRTMRSRLVPVDAAADFEPLHARYPAGHLLLPAVIGISYLPPERGGPLVYGTLRDIVSSAVAVPAHLKALFEQVPGRGMNAEPRYEVEIAVGRLGLPYVRAARLLH